MTSLNGGIYTFWVRNNGNLQICLTSDTACASPIWQSNTTQAALGAYKLAMQTDGNLVLTAPTTYATVFQSHSASTGSANYLQLNADGTLVVYASTSGAYNTLVSAQIRSGQTVASPMQFWSPNGAFYFRVQPDSNLCIYLASNSVGTSPTWCRISSNPGSQPSYKLSVNSAGSVQLNSYSSTGALTSSSPLFDSHTTGAGSSAVFAMNNDSTLTVSGGAYTYYLTSQLLIGQTMKAPAIMLSPSGTYMLRVQTDGNVCVYVSSNTGYVWCRSGYPNATANYLFTFQRFSSDHSLSLFSPTGTQMWNTYTYCAGGDFASVTDSGALLIQSTTGITSFSSAWAYCAAGSSCQGKTCTASGCSVCQAAYGATTGGQVGMSVGSMYRKSEPEDQKGLVRELTEQGGAPAS